jgi:hypothetical protein
VFDGADPWAVVAAGGSIPDLPPGADPELLAAIPRMRPFGPAPVPARQWALAEPGRQYLVYACPGETIHLDLSADPASFTARWIGRRTGQAVPETPGAIVRGGQVVDLNAPGSSGPGVLWLTRSSGPAQE